MRPSTLKKKFSEFFYSMPSLCFSLGSLGNFWECLAILGLPWCIFCTKTKDLKVYQLSLLLRFFFILSPVFVVVLFCFCLNVSPFLRDSQNRRQPVRKKWAPNKPQHLARSANVSGLFNALMLFNVSTFS